MRFFTRIYGSNAAVPGKGLVLLNLNIDVISKHSRFLILLLPAIDMMKKSPFAIQKALIEIDGEPKSVKRLRSSDLLIETNSALQTKSFLLAKSFLDSPLKINPHKSLNTSRGVISEPDLLSTSEVEILDGFSDQGVIQIAVWSRNVLIVPSPIHPNQNYVRNGKLKSKYIIKINKNITYLEARKLIVPQSSQPYTQAAKSSNKNMSTQTDENVTKVKCPPLKLLQPLSSIPKSDISITTPVISTSSTQAELLPSTSSTEAIVS
ncbi:uncharacterized protein TNCV_382581 [Trichonephila clavipes]|nr:uncharacterized protein TNCV_382581 [Trichonephila clavipes]